MSLVPHEVAIGGIFMPPLLIASTFGLIASLMTTRVLNRLRMSKYFFYPPLLFMALAVIYTVLIGTLVIKV